MKVSKTKKHNTSNLYIPYISLKTVIKLLNGEYIFFHHMIKFFCLNQFLMFFFYYIIILPKNILLSDIPQCQSCSRRGVLYMCKTCINNFTSFIPRNNYTPSQSNINIENSPIIKKEKRKYIKKKKGITKDDIETNLTSINKEDKALTNMDFTNCFINDSQPFNNIDDLEEFYDRLQ